MSLFTCSDDTNKLLRLLAQFGWDVWFYCDEGGLTVRIRGNKFVNDRYLSWLLIERFGGDLLAIKLRTMVFELQDAINKDLLASFE